MVSLRQALDTLVSVEFYDSTLACCPAALCVGLAVPLVVLTLRRYAQGYLLGPKRHLGHCALRDLPASLASVLDKPSVVGDFTALATCLARSSRSL